MPNDNHDEHGRFASGSGGGKTADAAHAGVQSHHLSVPVKPLGPEDKTLPSKQAAIARANELRTTGQNVKVTKTVYNDPLSGYKEIQFSVRKV